MGYTPTYYSSMQDSFTSICKSMLPFSLKKPRLKASEENALKQQSNNLNWQQNAYHEILNLMGLCKEGLLAESEVDAFRTRLLETLVGSKSLDLENEVENEAILKDKLMFLEDLLLGNCITPRDYHVSKRVLLRRDGVDGVEVELEIEAGDVVNDTPALEEWSTIDLRDDQSSITKGKSKSSSIKKLQKGMRHIKDSSASVFGFGALGRSRHQKSIFDQTPIAKNTLLDDHEPAAKRYADENCDPNPSVVPNKSTQNPFRVKSMFSR